VVKHGIRAHFDDRDGFKPGWKYSEYEMMGVPIRIEIGQKDIEKNQVCLVRRDTMQKSFIPETNLETEIDRLLKEIQANLFVEAKKILDEKTFPAKNFEEFVDVIKEKRGMAELAWCGAAGCEDKFKTEVGATVRCLRDASPKDPCAVCGQTAKHQIFVARAY